MAGRPGNPNWVKGVSGNPNGGANGPQKTADYDVRKLAQQWTPKAILTAAAIMNNAKVPPATRLAAADLLLKRAHGNPATPVITDPDKAVPLNFLEMSDEDLLNNAGRLDDLLARATVASQVKGSGSLN